MVRATVWSDHKPIPQTYRLKPVPVEIIEAAKRVANSPNMALDGTTLDARIATDWLANPENWEADND